MATITTTVIPIMAGMTAITDVGTAMAITGVGGVMTVAITTTTGMMDAGMAMAITTATAVVTTGVVIL